MCVAKQEGQTVQNTVPKTEWAVGWKVFKKVKSKEGVLLKSLHSPEFWTPGERKALHPDAAGFTGSRMKEGEYGYHLLQVQPTICGLNEVIAPVEYLTSSVVEVGKDGAANVSSANTVVAQVVRLTSKAYNEAIACEGSPSAKKTKQAVKKLVKKVSKQKKGKVSDAVALLKKLKSANKKNFCAAFKKKFKDNTKTEISNLFARAKTLAKISR